MDYAYFDSGDIMFASAVEIENGDLATLDEVIEWYIQKGSTIEGIDQSVVTKDGIFKFKDGDYIRQNN